MFDINVYSVINSIIGACILMILCFLLEKLVIRGTITSTVYFLTFPLILLRLLLPVEIVNKTTLIQVNKILPSVIRLLKRELFHIMPNICYAVISVSTLDLIALSFSMISIMKCSRLIYAYCALCIRLKYVLPSQDEKILSVLADIQKKNHFVFQVRVIQNEFIHNPFEFGLLKQTICLPPTDYSEEELYFILSHELQHFKNKSNWFRMLTNFLTAIFWWNPFVLFYSASIVPMIEINCDEHTIIGFDDGLKAKYLSCLLSELKHRHDQKANKTIHFFSSNGSSLSKRFRFITEKHKKSKIICCLSIFIITSAFLTSYFFMVLPYFDVPDSEIQMPEFTKENSYILRKGDSYIIYLENEPYIILDSISETFSTLPIMNED